MLDNHDLHILRVLRDAGQPTSPVGVARATGHPFEETKSALLDLVLSGHVAIADTDDLRYRLTESGVLTLLQDATRQEPDYRTRRGLVSGAG